MLTDRSVALALMLIGLTGAPALAATCNLTVEGAHILDDEDCTVSGGRGSTSITVGTYGTIIVRESAMSVRIAGQQSPNRRNRRRYVSLGQVVASDNSNDRMCYFGQKAVLCVEP